MTNERDISLILIPDYLSVRSLSGQSREALIVADPEKVPGELRNDKFQNVQDALVRRTIMQMVPRINRAVVMTPAMAYYRRVFELRDDCFYADLTARLIASGAYVSVVTGLERAKIPKRAQEWMTSMAEDGVKMFYADPAPVQGQLPDLVTASTVEAYYKQGLKELYAAQNAIVTPYAWDEAKERGITIFVGKGGSL